jgi:hypothetical protein
LPELFGKSGTAAAYQLVKGLYIKIHRAKLKDKKVGDKLY